MKKEFKDKAEAEKFYDELRAENKYEFDAYLLPDGAGYGLQWIESKTYTAHDGKSYTDEVWLTDAGDLMLVQDLTEDHAKNVLRMLLRKERAAFELVSSLMSSGKIDLEDLENGDTIQAELTHTLH